MLAEELSENSRNWLIDKPVGIAVYVALALVLRFVLHRFIDRLARSASGTGRPPRLRWRRRPVEKKPPRDPRARARRAQRAETIASVLKSAVSFLVLIWVVLQSLAILGVNVAPLVASAGVVGIAIGFGAQNLVRDFITGLFMLFEDQYGVGDIVDLGEATGTIETVGLRITTLRDMHGTLWYVRNGEIQRVANFSQEHAVAVVELPVAHATDVDLACRVAHETAQAASDDAELQSEMLSPPQMLGVSSVTADTVTLRLTVAVRANSQWAVERELRRRILGAFEAHDVAAPYPSGFPVPRGAARV